MQSPKLKITSEARLVFQSYYAVEDEINRLTKKESEQWSSPLDPKQQQALDSVGGFEMFGTLPQTLRLTEILRMSYNEVLLVPWEIGFAAYTYDVKSNEYNRLILK
jgi:hypothetical protein